MCGELYEANWSKISKSVALKISKLVYLDIPKLFSVHLHMFTKIQSKKLIY